MGDVTRYDCAGGGIGSYCQGCYHMDEAEDGEYVLASDYDALRAEVERLRGLLQECEPAVLSEHLRDIGTRIAKPSTLLARLRASLAGTTVQADPDLDDECPSAM